MSSVTPAVESFIDRLRHHPDRAPAEMEDHAARYGGDGVPMAVKR